MRFAQMLTAERLLFDGGLGSMLYRRGMQTSDVPEMMSIEHPDWVREIHSAYAEAGAQVVTSNTLGANAISLSKHKLDDRLEEIVTAAIRCLKEGVAGRALAALSVGPLGEMLAPLGTLTWQMAYDAYARQAIAGEAAGADIAYIETMGDIAEARIAALAVLENTRLPVCASFVYSAGVTMMGHLPECAAIIGKGIGLSAVATNCTGLPEDMLKTLERSREVCDIPFIAMPNAGLPIMRDGIAEYTLEPSDMAPGMRALLQAGASGIGGCCGTTPMHIAAFAAEIAPFKTPPPPANHAHTYLCSPRKFLPLDEFIAQLREIPADLDEIYELETPALIDLRNTPDPQAFLTEAVAATRQPLSFKVASDEQAAAVLRLYPGIAAIDGPVSAVTRSRYGALSLE